MRVPAWGGIPKPTPTRGRLRRLRAAISVYRDAIPVRRDWGAELKHLEHEIGGARDWDVLTGEIGQAAMDSRSPEGLAVLLRKTRARQRETHGHTPSVLGNPQILRLMSETGPFRA